MVLGLPGGGRGEHRRPLPHASCRLSPCAPYGHSTLQQAIVALASRRLSQSFPPQAVWQAWTTRYDRALPSRREQGEPLSRRRRVPREGPLGHVVRRRGTSECKRVVLCRVQPWTRAAGTASSKLDVDGPGHERAPEHRPLSSFGAAPCGRTGRLLSLSRSQGAHAYATDGGAVRVTAPE